MSENAESAVLAGGCFWIMQQLLRDRDGVISTRVGWIGGENENPTQENNVGHAEAVEVTFDPDRHSYRELLEYFFMVHRPDLGEDVVGTGYRSETRSRPSLIWLSSADQLLDDDVILRTADQDRQA